MAPAALTALIIHGAAQCRVGTQRRRSAASPQSHTEGTQPGAPRSTTAGAPTDAAHADAGDGTLAGSTSAGLTVEELLDQAADGKTVEGGTGSMPHPRRAMVCDRSRAMAPAGGVTLTAPG